MKYNICVLGGKRTAFGTFGGSLKDVGATELATEASVAALKQSELSAEQIEHVVFGHVVQSEKDSIYLPRHVGLRVGVPVERGALGVNRLCGSGFQSWINLSQMILTGEISVGLAGGVEQMSRIPFVSRGARWGYRMGHGELEDYLTAALTDQYAQMPMALTAEKLAEKYKITREQCDLYSVQSQARYRAAHEKGYFKSEIAPVSIKTKKGVTVFESDEHPKPETSRDSIKSLKPLFKENGVVTAATASGIVDGAAASVLCSEEFARKGNLKVRARLRSWATVGCDPTIMGIGPAHAIRQLLKQADLKMDQIDLFEVNEAFAGQYLAVEKELGLPQDRTNVNGGAIAVGHPLGASGTRIMNHLVYELERRQAKFAVGSACIGGGQGIALLIEREK